MSILTTNELAFILTDKGLSIGPKANAPQGIDVGKSCNELALRFRGASTVVATIDVLVSDVNLERIQAVIRQIDPEE